MGDDLYLTDYEATERQYEQPTVGTHVAVIGSAYDVGLQETPYGVQHKVVVAYELDDRDSKGRRFVVFTPYNATAHPKGTLREVIDAACPDLSANDKKRLAIKRLANKCLLVSITLTERGKARVKAVARMPKGAAGITPEQDYKEAFGLAKWYRARALTREGAEAAKLRQAKERLESSTGDGSEAGDTIPF